MVADGQRLTSVPVSSRANTDIAFLPRPAASEPLRNQESAPAQRRNTPDNLLVKTAMMECTAGVSIPRPDAASESEYGALPWRSSIDVVRRNRQFSRRPDKSVPADDAKTGRRYYQ